MNGADLAQFQFDYDQTWAALFLHPDGTVYARYGSRNADGPMALNSVPGLKTTMRRVLTAHAKYPAASESIKDKRGPAPRFARADEIPSQTIRKILSRQDQQACIHCHNVYDAERDVLLSENHYDPGKRWKYPPPENLGLSINLDSGNQVTRVTPGSAAEMAGIRAGDVITEMNGQAIYSIADIQFVLHHLPDPAKLNVEYERDAATRHALVQLKPGWRRSDISWRASMYGMPPKPGLWVQTLAANRKLELGIPSDKLALEVRGVFGPDVQRAGLQKNDIIVGFGGRDEHLTHGQFHAALRLNYFQPGAQLKLRVLRDRKPRELEVRFVTR